METTHLQFIIRKLHNSIMAVAPIDSISIGNILDKGTWIISFGPEATQPQKNAAQSVITSFDVNANDLIQTGIETRKSAARLSAKNIPNWATWTEAQALAWIQTNIENPLAAPIPANPMSVQQIRAVLVSLVAVLNTIRLMLIAMAKLIIALRDEIWPDLPE